MKSIVLGKRQNKASKSLRVVDEDILPVRAFRNTRGQRWPGPFGSLSSGRAFETHEQEMVGRVNFFSVSGRYGHERARLIANRDRHDHNARKWAMGGGSETFFNPTKVFGLLNTQPQAELPVGVPALGIDGWTLTCRVKVGGFPKGTPGRVVALTPDAVFKDDIRTILARGLYEVENTIAFQFGTSMDFDGVLDENGVLVVTNKITPVTVTDDEGRETDLPLQYPPQGTRYIVAVNA